MKNYESKKNTNNALIMVIVGIVAIVILVTVYKIVGLKTDKKETNNTPNQTVITSVNNNEDDIVRNKDAGNNNEDDIIRNKDDGNNNQVVDTVKKVFNDKVIFTLQEFNIDGDEVIVRINVVNNYENEINLWPDGVYLMNSSGTRFPLDIHKHLAKGENKFNLVTGENKTFEFYFNKYNESDELDIKIDKIWCMDPRTSMKEKIVMKLK